jgi:hypothetical protein
MTPQITTLIPKTAINILRLTLLGSLTVGASLLAQGTAANESETAAPASLIKIVRQATQQYADVNAATAAGYAPFLGCLSGPDEGAMGGGSG